MVTLGAKRVETNPQCCSDKFTVITLRTSLETQGQLVGTIESSQAINGTVLPQPWKGSVVKTLSEGGFDFKCKEERNLTV